MGRCVAGIFLAVAWLCFSKSIRDDGALLYEEEKEMLVMAVCFTWRRRRLSMYGREEQVERRLRCTCKSLKRACQQLMQSNTCSPGQCLKGSQHPWLLLPNHKGDVNGSLTFYDMFEGRFRHIKLPSPFAGGGCCGPCRGGWVPITNGVNKLRLKLVPDVFLVNPITGQTLTLPPLDTIPGYDWHAGYATDRYNASWFISKLDFSGPSPAEPGSIIAGLFFHNTTIAFCKVGGKSWITAGIEFDDDIDYTDILFSLDGTTLYATAFSVMDDYDHYPAIQTKTLSLIFQDNDNDHDHDHAEVNIRFKCIIPTFLNNIQDKLEPPHIRDLNEDTCLVENHNHHGYLFETCNNKLLIVLKTTDCMLTDMSEAARSKSSVLFKLIDLITTRFFGDNDDSDDDDDAYDAWKTHYHYTRRFKVLEF